MAGATLPLSPDPFAGRTLGKYEVLCRLSTGGMSEIFLAFQRGLAGFRKLLVIKSILPNIQGEEEFVRMFLDEAKITAAFNHPNIAQVFDLDVDDEQLFLAMEFVPGCTLVELARACRAANEPIPTGLTLLAVKETALALHYAHTFTDPLGRKQTVIHRDVAEKNIMVTYEGTTKLLDFGIAKSLNRSGRTSVGMVKGTSGYMSPEQILGEPLDARSDLFSLGVVLHECLTGMRLFHGKDAEAGMIAALKEQAAPPSQLNAEVTAELDEVVLKSLERSRDDRQTTCLEFARALERAAGPLMWHPEQSGELVQRLFADRREQTRQLLEEAQHGKAEVTREIRLAGLLGDAKPAPPATPFKPTPALATPKPISRRSPAQVSPPTAPLPASKTASPRQAPDERLTTVPPTPVTRQQVVEEPEPDEPSAADVTQVGAAPASRSPSGEVPWATAPAPKRRSDESDDEEVGLRTTPSTALPVRRHEEDDDERVGLNTAPSTSLPKDLFDLDGSGEKPRAVTGNTLTVRDGRDESTTESRPSPLPAPRSFEDTPVAEGPRRALWPFLAGGAVLLVVLAGAGYRFFAPSGPPAAAVEPVALKPTGRAPPTAEVPRRAAEPSAAEPSAAEPSAAEPSAAEPSAAEPAAVEAATERAPPPRQPAPEVAHPASAIAAAEAKAQSLRAAKAKRRGAAKVAAAAAEDAKGSESAEDKAWAAAAEKIPAKRGGSGQLTLVTDPWAKVLFKSQDLGVTPLFKVPLPAGHQVLRLVGADKKVLLLPVDIKEGAVTAVRVPLSGLRAE